MLYVYPDPPTVTLNGELVLRLMTDDSAFRVSLFRVGATGVEQNPSLIHPGPKAWEMNPKFLTQDLPTLVKNIVTPWAADWDWPKLTIPVNGLPAGIYVAMCEEQRGGPPPMGFTTTDGDYGKALFVIRPQWGTVIDDNYSCRSATTRIAGGAVPTGRVRLRAWRLDGHGRSGHAPKGDIIFSRITARPSHG